MLLNICIFSRAFHPAVGGLERMAQILATQFSKAGHRVVVITDKPSTAEDTFPFEVVRTSSYWQRTRSFARADVVLFMNVSLHGLVAAIFAGTPLIFSHQGIYQGAGILGHFLEWLKRQACRFFGNICCSNFVATNIPALSTVIPNAFDDVLFKNEHADTRARDFVFCGRLVSDKGADVCLRSFHQVLQHYPAATLSLIGEGPERDSLLSLTKGLRLSNSVEFLGSLLGRPLVDALKRHSCLVVPSLWQEPFGIVALEGIACCDTVIVSKRGGLPEAIGPCGVAVEPTVEELSAAMIQVMQAKRKNLPLPGQVSQMVRNQHLAEHSASKVAFRYLSVLGSAVERSN